MDAVRRRKATRETGRSGRRGNCRGSGGGSGTDIGTGSRTNSSTGSCTDSGADSGIDPFRVARLALGPRSCEPDSPEKAHDKVVSDPEHAAGRRLRMVVHDIGRKDKPRATRQLGRGGIRGNLRHQARGTQEGEGDAKHAAGKHASLEAGGRKGAGERGAAAEEAAEGAHLDKDRAEDGGVVREATRHRHHRAIREPDDLVVWGGGEGGSGVEVGQPGFGRRGAGRRARCRLVRLALGDRAGGPEKTGGL